MATKLFLGNKITAKIKPWVPGRTFIFDSHGGECCGVTHVHSFPGSRRNDTTGRVEPFTPETAKIEVEAIAERIRQKSKERFADEDDGYDEDCDCSDCVAARRRAENRTDDETWGHLFECVLAGHQIPTWENPLKEAGWVEARRWINDNSGNECVMLTYVVPSSRS